jgi:hypothetical protein
MLKTAEIHAAVLFAYFYTPAFLSEISLTVAGKILLTRETASDIKLKNKMFSAIRFLRESCSLPFI